MAKGLKLKARKFWGLIPTFVEVTGEKLFGGRGAFFLNRVKSVAYMKKSEFALILM